MIFLVALVGMFLFFGIAVAIVPNGILAVFLCFLWAALFMLFMVARDSER